MSGAVVVTGFGGPEVLQWRDVAPPRPGPGEVSIAVRAAGVGPTDLAIRRGALRTVFALPEPGVLGFEAAGVVDAVGDGVQGTSVGDEVVALLPALGGYAEHAVASVWAPKPATVSWQDAAALPASAEAAVGVLRQVGATAGVEGVQVVPDKGMCLLLEQQAGDAGGCQGTDVPGAALRDICESFGPETREARLDRREADDVLRVRGGESEDDAAADVLPHHVHGPDREVLDQSVEILGGDCARVVLVRDVRVTEAPGVHGVHTVMGGEKRDELGRPTRSPGTRGPAARECPRLRR